MEVVKSKATTNKVVRERVSILNSELTKKNLTVSDHPKWKLMIIKWLDVQVRDKYQYLFRISYNGTARLRANDVVTNSDGAVFLVIQEANRVAMIVSKDSFYDKPKVYGSLIVITNLNNKKNKE